MSMRAEVVGAVAICVAAVLWGLDGVVLTPRLYRLEVPFVVVLLHAIPFVLMQPFLFRCYRRLGALPPREWAVLGLVSLTGGWLGTLAIVKALFLVDFNQLSVVVLLQKLQPVFAILLAALVLGERITRPFLLQATVALAGAYLLTFGARAPELSHSGTAGGALWAALAAAAFGSATVFGKRLLAALDFREATFGRYGVTALIGMAYLGVSGGTSGLATMTAAEWTIVLVIGITTGSGAIFLYYFGLTRVKATVSAICELCLPLSAILLDYLVNDSVLTFWQWVGAAVLIAAILAVTRQGQTEPEGAATPS